MRVSASVRPPDSRTVANIRRILLGTLVVGLIGTGIELLLLEHFEEWRQTAPLAVIACALVALLWHAFDRGASPIRALQILMLASAMTGLAGVVLHYQGNAEFELEMYPTRAGFELFRKSMMGATPALAPGTMVLLALVGLAYAYRHPCLAVGVRDFDNQEEQ